MAPLDRTAKVKRLFFQILIGCLVGAAAIAVVSVLVGSFNDVLARALGTIGLVALHALLSFSYISETEKRDKKDGARSIELFSNTVFTLIIVSFITSVFAVWQLLGGELTVKLYELYTVILFATLHADVLYRIRGFDKKIDNTVAGNYIFMAAVVVMLMIVIFAPKPDALGDFYYRLLSAIGIIDATMTITAVIMHKLYLQRHPQAVNEAVQASPAQHRDFWKHPLVVLLLVYLGFQVIGSLVVLALRGF